MRPEIETYLRQHGAQYTTEALRRKLITAGYDPAEIDAALRETEVGRGPRLAETRVSRSRFWWSAVGLHLVALLLVTIWVFSRSYTYAPFAAVFLAVMLLVGLGLSGLIGRALLPRGLVVALIVPVISVFGLSGLCLATIGGTSIQVPPRTGVMDLQIDPPLAFEGSGATECYDPEGAFSIYAPDLGTLDGRLVSVWVATAGDPSAQTRTISLSVNLLARTGTGAETAYGTPDDAPIELDAASDGLSGTVRFERLAALVFEGGFVPDPITGTISWTCD